MKKEFEITQEMIKSNIHNLKKLIQSKGLDGIYISSFDQFLNEYVPLADNHRYYLTGFTGSMAEVLIPVNGKVRLYVDGRYHEQADLEVDHEEVEVVKVGGNISTTASLAADVKKIGIKNLGYEADRTALGFLKQLSEAAQETVPLAPNELSKIIDFASLPELKEVQLVPREWRGRDTLEKTAQIFSSAKEGMFLTALDSIAWITNCRGYHLPFLSSFYAKALLTKEKVYIFVTPNTPVSEKAKKEIGLEWIYINYEDLGAELDRLQNTLHLEKVKFDPGMLNSQDYSVLLNVFGTERLQEYPGGIYEYQCIKEPVELAQIEESFKRADKAIFNTMKWVKTSIKEGKTITELDLYNQTSVFYKEQGAKDQSFNTIAAVGPNASIMHYGSSTDKIVIKAEDMILLDSGGYFDGGWATDTTRTFLGCTDASKAHPKMVEMYTLTLKGFLACIGAVFPEGTKGMVLDGLARNAMRKRGYDFGHGTGHGVGIHVHEPGARISSISQVPMKEGQVCSIEPGIYIPGFGGVRLENVVAVEKHPEFKGMLHFRSLVYIGFDPALIDMKLLNEEERAQLDEYEAECLKRGTSLRALK
ncbi:MAG TPA: M24 family metallopeptidase [Bacteriovoracaceae bacterium]|nr:M24 family metallopeptidase [Bacteriovoracaceae bacterium]